MSHAVATLRQERQRLAERRLDLTRLPLPPPGPERRTLISLAEETRRQLVEIDAAIAALMRNERSRAA